MAGFITPQKNILSQPAWCSGILLFRPNSIIRKSLKDTWNLYVNHINKGYPVNDAWEQPFLCFIFCLRILYKLDLNKFVYEERENLPKSKISENVVFNHFCGLRSQDRYTKMRNYVFNNKQAVGISK
jgi:hypothetical protein